MNRILDRILEWLDDDRGWEKMVVIGLIMLILSFLVSAIAFVIVFGLLIAKVFGG